MRHKLVIGDIHGCRGEFLALLDLAGLGEKDAIVAVGDLVDRGPDSAGVLDFFQATPVASAVMGNHELKNVRAHRGELRPALSQQITRHQLGESRYAQACAFMASLPRAIELEEVVIVHGFWQPGMALAAQPDAVIVGTLTGERLAREACGGRAWYECYDGEKPLIVGHRDYLRSGQPLVFRDRVYALDTSCVHGGRLTGLLLPEFRVLSVPARRAHWSDVRRVFGGRTICA